MSVLTEPVLWLNKSWMAHGFKTIKESFTSVCANRGLFLDCNYVQHDIHSWIELPVQTDEFIQLLSTRIRKPEILVLSEYNQIPNRKVVFCRRNLWRRDNGRCQYCGKKPPPDEVTIDHIIPLSKGGKTTFENCVLCCIACNLRKGNRSLVEVGMKLQKLKKLPNGEWATIYYDCPKRPQWNPLYALRRRTYPKSWAAFLRHFDESLYWEVELQD